MEEKLKLDPIDQRIIEAVKRNGRLAKQVLGEATGLSATPETSVMTSTPRHKSAVWLSGPNVAGAEGYRGFKSHPLPALDRVRTEDIGNSLSLRHR
ncbi:AsnC family protein [Rhizobium nepotum]|uniref:AsnC family protein n=1 Tax=Rhizobium nepotum TaxID=1035271 RepID=UPI003CF94E9F